MTHLFGNPALLTLDARISGLERLNWAVTFHAILSFSTYGCRVIGADLSPSFVAVGASEIARWATTLNDRSDLRLVRS
jgi:hypothetical protein